MAVKGLTGDKLTAAKKDFNINTTPWAVIAPERRGTITGKLPPQPDEPLLNSEGLTRTQARRKNFAEGKHKTVLHERRSSNPRAQPRGENCSTCGKVPAPIWFGSSSAYSTSRGQYCGQNCIPFETKCRGPNGAH